MNAKLTVENLCHVYGENTPFRLAALDDVSFSVAPGELIGIIGHTGSGKSTLISHMNGLMKPTSGRILLDGADIWADPKRIRDIRFRVGLVFQYPEHQLFEDTVCRDIAFGPTNMGLDEAEVRERVNEAMEFVGLGPEYRERSPFELSGGQKRRVAIAGVIAMRPEVLILDELTAGLDPRGCQELLGQICEFRRRTGCTVLLVSHSMDEVAEVADRILVMNHGHVEMFDTPGKVFAESERIEAIGLTVPAVTKVFRLLADRGLPVDPSIFRREDALRALLALRKGGRA